eukprot:TRINITY_DN65183_c0_g1_i1.p1 TRINITY_DN65183_c0_g1~~TRINITY_DN65183_c0_g1_i1.p1  ORF type:complete len:824 (+),score=225.70 TRINITY_DN65183_c0_g1_i1:78-2474(+)
MRPRPPAGLRLALLAAAAQTGAEAHAACCGSRPAARACDGPVLSADPVALEREAARQGALARRLRVLVAGGRPAELAAVAAELAAAVGAPGMRHGLAAPGEVCAGGPGGFLEAALAPAAAAGVGDILPGPGGEVEWCIDTIVADEPSVVRGAAERLMPDALVLVRPALDFVREQRVTVRRSILDSVLALFPRTGKAAVLREEAVRDTAAVYDTLKTLPGLFSQPVVVLHGAEVLQQRGLLHEVRAALHAVCPEVAAAHQLQPQMRTLFLRKFLQIGDTVAELRGHLTAVTELRRSEYDAERAERGADGRQRELLGRAAAFALERRQLEWAELWELGLCCTMITGAFVTGGVLFAVALRILLPACTPVADAARAAAAFVVALGSNPPKQHSGLQALGAASPPRQRMRGLSLLRASRVDMADPLREKTREELEAEEAARRAEEAEQRRERERRDRERRERKKLISRSSSSPEPRSPVRFARTRSDEREKRTPSPHRSPRRGRALSRGQAEGLPQQRLELEGGALRRAVSRPLTRLEIELGHLSGDSERGSLRRAATTGAPGRAGIDVPRPLRDAAAAGRQVEFSFGEPEADLPPRLVSARRIESGISDQTQPTSDCLAQSTSLAESAELRLMGVSRVESTFDGPLHGMSAQPLLAQSQRRSGTSSILTSPSAAAPAAPAPERGGGPPRRGSATPPRPRSPKMGSLQQRDAPARQRRVSLSPPEAQLSPGPLQSAGARRGSAGQPLPGGRRGSVDPPVRRNRSVTPRGSPKQRGLAPAASAGTSPRELQLRPLRLPPAPDG